MLKPLAARWAHAASAASAARQHSVAPTRAWLSNTHQRRARIPSALTPPACPPAPCFLLRPQVRCKEEIWNMMNRDWLEKQVGRAAPWGGTRGAAPEGRAGTAYLAAKALKDVALGVPIWSMHSAACD